MRTTWTMHIDATATPAYRGSIHADRQDGLTAVLVLVEARPDPLDPPHHFLVLLFGSLR